MAFGFKEVEIVKPRTDKREYRRVVLSNFLEVLLISDPETDKAAASMNVDVGSFCDPDGLEGLAHFLEHMLFYASEKYPLENSYSKFIIEVSCELWCTVYLMLARYPFLRSYLRCMI
ncbi:hypothetical protein Taro_017188 [Colocasia esculenta]|uniref:Peptidase M16 N-terminal domain-containing protein n=1 Tax=Colocasia esculenta TaxID=4460 RepID=A0A843UMF6_COLES|nr:hypothetical protein [Colocasia esculenta]